MNDNKMKRFEVAVYGLIIMFACILILLGRYVWQTGILNSLLLNLSTELLGAGVLFFVIQKFFSIGESSSGGHFEKITADLAEKGATIKNSSEMLQKILDDTLRIRNAITPIDGIRLNASLNDIRAGVSETQLQKITLEQQSAMLYQSLKEIEKIKNSAILSDGAFVLEAISNIRKTLGTIEGDIVSLTKKITTEVEHQQDELLKRIERKFNDSAVMSHDNLRDAIKKELASFAQHPESQNITAERLANMVVQSIMTMGMFQRDSIKTESEKAFSTVLSNIMQSMENLSGKVEEVQNTALSLAVLPPRRD